MTLDGVKELVKSLEEELNKYITYDIPEMKGCRYGVQTVSVTVRIEEPTRYHEMVKLLTRNMSRVENEMKKIVAVLVALGYGKYNFVTNTMYLIDTALERVYGVLDGGNIRSTLAYIVDKLECKLVLIPFLTGYEPLREGMKKELGSDFEKKGIEVSDVHFLNLKDIQAENANWKYRKCWEWLSNLNHVDSLR